MDGVRESRGEGEGETSGRSEGDMSGRSERDNETNDSKRLVGDECME